MSRLDKLKSLLSRVEQRRTEPRLVAVSGGHASANTNVASQARAPARAPERAPERVDGPPAARPRDAAPLELAPKLAVPLEQVAVATAPAPSSMPPPPLAAAETKLHSSLPPPARTPAAPSSTVPPSAGTSAAAHEGASHRSTTEVLPPVPSRIAPSPALPFESAVRVTSQPRVEAAKSFGELLEQSLALRPKAG